MLINFDTERIGSNPFNPYSATRQSQAGAACRSCEDIYRYCPLTGRLEIVIRTGRQLVSIPIFEAMASAQAAGGRKISLQSGGPTIEIRRGTFLNSSES
jgi:hypothetical protein